MRRVEKITLFWKHNSMSLRLLVRDISVHEDNVPSVNYIRNSWTYATQNMLKLPNSKLSCKVKRKRLNRGAWYGLEVPVIYTFNGHEKPIDWIKSKTQEDIKLEQSMKNLCLK